ncbi:MAG: carbohydrate ABC transporter substrate-binding protein [Clostridiales bacterium]|nr:carbohydrate ABC transporter substrate-binding protein [Clostridiales bacterium]
MKKKIFSLTLALLLVVGILPVGFAQSEPVLKLAAIETAYGADMWKEIVAAFEEANPEVKVELIIDKNLEDVISPSMKAGDFPDVIHLATGRPAALTDTFIKDNAIEEISDVLLMNVPGEEITVGEKIIPGFLDTAMTNPYGDGKTYLAPAFYGPCGLFYNAGLFTEKGWDLPETWEDMWALAEEAAKEEIALFAYPTTGYFDAFFYALMFEVGGVEFFEKATHYEEGIWETDEAKSAFDIVGKLASYTHVSVPSNANNENFLKNQQLILDNKALFMPNGSWVIGEMAEAPRAEGFEWGFMALPAIEKGGDHYSYTFYEQHWIPAGAENKELAKEFIAFLYSDKAVEIFAKAGAVQPIVDVADKLEGDMKLYYSIYDEGAKPAMGLFATTDPVEGVELGAVWWEPVNSLVSGDKTQEEWVQGIIQASDKLREALK